MKSRFILFGFSVLFLLNTINSQSYMEIAEKISLIKGTTFIKDISRGSNCDPDSILFFGFENQNDSTLGIRRVFHKYGEGSIAIYEYEFIDESGVLKLNTIDSTVFDFEGRPVLNEIWEFNSDSNKLLLEERSLYYPHEGIILKDYSFFEDMVNEFNYTKGEFLDYDSVIVFDKDFFTGLLKPMDKIIQIFSPDGFLEEAFSYEEFNMSWYPTTKRQLFYTASSRIARIEESSWNSQSNNYILNSTLIYSYDSNTDSLVNILTTNNFTGQSEQRMDMTYNTTQNASNSMVYFWDNENNLWHEGISISGEFDELDRIEVLELKFDFFGDVEESKYEYVYIGDISCPHYINSYWKDNGNLVFAGRIYFYPFSVSSTFDQHLIQWSAYPNPTKDGIWIEAPIGSQIQIATLLGNVIYSGQISDEREFISLNHLNTQILLTIQDGSSISSQVIIVNK